MKNIILDGKNAIFGRMASIAAKELLKGNSVDIINCEEVRISGSKKNFVLRIIQKRNMGRGASLKGPIYIRKSDRIVKRMMRGMLPFEKEKGRAAHKRLRCHIGPGDISEENSKKALSFNHKTSAPTFAIKDVIKLLT